jgi:hypothetical protein
MEKELSSKHLRKPRVNTDSSRRQLKVAARANLATLAPLL